MHPVSCYIKSAACDGSLAAVAPLPHCNIWSTSDITLYNNMLSIALASVRMSNVLTTRMFVRWRNLLRVAALPFPPNAGKGDKKREAPSAEILARVRIYGHLCT